MKQTHPQCCDSVSSQQSEMELWVRAFEHSFQAQERSWLQFGGRKENKTANLVESGPTPARVCVKAKGRKLDTVCLWRKRALTSPPSSASSSLHFRFRFFHLGAGLFLSCHSFGCRDVDFSESRASGCFSLCVTTELRKQNDVS